LLPSCKATDSTVDKVIATAVPISERGICMIQGCLEEVKIGGKAQWWFSTSQSGGFRPDAGINAKEVRKSKTSLRRHGGTEKKQKRLADLPGLPKSSNLKFLQR
jgi:hypothetical protein